MSATNDISSLRVARERLGFPARLPRLVIHCQFEEDVVRTEAVSVVAEMGALVIERASFETVKRIGVQPGSDLVEVDAC